MQLASLRLRLSISVFALGALGCGGKSSETELEEESDPYGQQSGSGVVSGQQPDGVDQNTPTSTDTEASENAQILSRSPVVVNSGARVMLTGRNFSPEMTLALSDGTPVNLDVQSSTNAFFVVPDQSTYGAFSLTASQNNSTQKISLFFTGDRTDFPIMTAPAETICAGTQYYNATGTLSQGTKDCAPNAASDCASDGEIGCLTTSEFASAATSGLAAKVLVGNTVAGISGAAAGSSVSNCSADGQIACVTVASYTAAATSGLAAKIVSGNTVAGIAGSATAESHSNCASDGATGCVATATYAAALTTGLASKVVSSNTVAGVAGSATAESHSNCASDGATGCVATATYTAALTTGLAAKVVSSNTVAGVAGGATAESHSNCTSDGATGCIAVAAYKSAATSGLAAKIVSGNTVAGVAGSATAESHSNCASDGATGCVAVASYTAAATSGLAAKIVSGNTVAGVAGSATAESHSDCATDGATGCVAVTAYKSAATSGLAAKVVSGNTVAGVAGSATAESHSNCAADGATGCVAVAAYTAAATSSLAAKIVSGNTVAGVAGSATAESHSNCTSDGATGCVAVASYTAAATSGLAAKIISGNTVAGVAGSATSESHSDCAADGATGCVAVASYPAAKINASYLAAGNVKNGMVIGGVTGTYKGEMLNIWDVRAGVNRGDGQLGRLKVKCRNATDPGLYNYDGALASITDAGTTSGTVFDVWDTIDDYPALPWDGYLPVAWSNDESYCGGVEAAANDTNVWKDVTTGGCSGSACRFKDKISNLEWSKTMATGRTWPQALNDCAGTYDGYSDWRLPTQKELMEAYTHGIRSAATANWISSGDMTGTNFWSSTSVSFANNNAWIVNLSYGYQNAAGSKTSPMSVTCVREDIRGHFLVAGDGYYAKSNNHYCHITTWQDWLDLGGPADANVVPVLPAIPSYLTSDGACVL